MDQLKVKDIINAINEIAKQENMTRAEVLELPIYLGRDDELNGIHTGWYVNLVDSDDDNEDNQYLVDMISEDRCNVELNGKAILIS